MAQYVCPKCEATDGLEVAVLVWAELIQEEDGNFQTDTTTPDDSSHEWDGNSDMYCTTCGHRGKVSEFDTETEDEGVLVPVEEKTNDA